MEELKALARDKEKKSRVRGEAYSIWLSTLTPANFMLVIGGSLLSLVAGASLLLHQGILSKEVAGLMALVSSAFTLIHNKLNCDQHQAECRKLRGIFRGMAEEYENLQSETDVDILKSKLDALNDARAQVLKTAGAEPSEKSLEKAVSVVERRSGS